MNPRNNKADLTIGLICITLQNQTLMSTYALFVTMFLLALAYLGWYVYISVKKIIPGWMHKFFEHQRKIKPHLDQHGEEVSAVGLLQTVLQLLAVASYVYSVQFLHIGFDTDTGTINPVLFFIHLIALIAIYWFGGRNLGYYWGFYKTHKNELDAKDKLKNAYGVKEWAKGDEIRNRLSSNK